MPPEGSSAVRVSAASSSGKAPPWAPREGGARAGWQPSISPTKDQVRRAHLALGRRSRRRGMAGHPRAPPSAPAGTRRSGHCRGRSGGRAPSWALSRAHLPKGVAPVDQLVRAPLEAAMHAHLHATRPSEVIRGHQRPSEAIRAHQRKPPCTPICMQRGHQRPSELIRAHQS